MDENHSSTCSIEGCGRERYGLGYCKYHYNRHRAGERFNPPPTRIRATEQPKFTVKKCSIDRCDREAGTFGYCAYHYGLHRSGVELPVPPTSARRVNGGGSYSRGYNVVMDNGKVKAKHIVIAEQVLGRPLKKGEQVHHWNKVRDDNRHENLLICTAAYHRLIHARMDAMEACGNPDWRKCIYCKQYAPLSEFYDAAVKNHGVHMHPKCCIDYKLNRKLSHASRTKQVKK